MSFELFQILWILCDGTTNSNAQLCYEENQWSIRARTKGLGYITITASHTLSVAAYPAMVRSQKHLYNEG